MLFRSSFTYESGKFSAAGNVGALAHIHKICFRTNYQRLEAAESEIRMYLFCHFAMFNMFGRFGKFNEFNKFERLAEPVELLPAGRY